MKFSTYLKRKWMLGVIPLLCTPRKQVESNPKSWSELPSEIRALIIDQMDPVSRAKYAQCSKLCEQEAKNSKNYLHGIKVCRLTQYEDLELCISHRANSFRDFWLTFEDSEDDTKTEVEYKCLENLEIVDSPVISKGKKVLLGKSEDVMHRYVNGYLEKYKHCIKSVHLDMKDAELNSVTLIRLKYLEDLSMESEPGDELDWLFNVGFVTRNQIMELRGLNMLNVNFEFEHIVDLKAYVAFFSSMALDEKKINNYLRMIKTGKINKNLESYKIQFSPTKKIDVKNIMKGLNISDHYEYNKEQTWFKFKFSSDVRKNGKFLVIFRPREMLEIEWRKDER